MNINKCVLEHKDVFVLTVYMNYPLDCQSPEDPGQGHSLDLVSQDTSL